MKSFVRPIYNRLIRPYCPRKVAVFNGIPVRGVRLFDSTDDFPEYEAPLIEAIRHRVSSGDDVVIVGGGRGVSSVVSAQETRPEGDVTTFEGSDARISLVRETARLNQVAAEVDSRHAVVGRPIDVAGETSAPVVPPTDLPESDVLVLDCEGAELVILSELEQRPRVLIVETHAFLDSPEDAVRGRIEDMNYDIVDRDVELAEKGVFILTAVQSEETRAQTDDQN